MEFQAVMSAKQANTADSHSQDEPQCLSYAENLTRMELILASSAVLILLFLKSREDKHIANDSNKASPRLFYRLCLLLFSFPSWFMSRHGKPPDISHSRGINEEICRLARSCWCLEIPFGVSCCVEEKQPKPINGHWLALALMSFCIDTSILSKLAWGERPSS